MRKSLLTSFFFFTIFLVAPFYVQAQNSTSQETQNRIETKDRVEQNQIDNEDARTEITQRVRDRQATQEPKVKTIKHERIQKHWGILERRIAASIERLEILITRIESRLLKIVEADPSVDITDIEQQITDAKVLLLDSKVLLAEASANLAAILDADDPKEAYDEFRDTVKVIKDTLIETHRILVHLIGDIKGLRVGDEAIIPTPEVTPTVEVIPTEEITPTTEPEASI